MEEFNIVRVQNLPVATSVSDNDMLLVAQGVGVKRVPPSLMKGEQGDPGLNIYLGVDATSILWKQGITGTWQNLIEIDKLRGPKGEKPLFRKVAGTLQLKYENEPDSAYVNIFDREELKMKFSDLTVEERDLLKFHYSDFTDAEKVELMKPATDAAEIVLKDAQEVNTNLTKSVETLEERADTVIRETSESKRLADLATKNASDATSLANTAAGNADTATGKANKAADLANKVAGETLLVKQETEKVKEATEKAAGLATGAAGLANTAAGNADTAAQNADDKAGLANTAAQNADKATKAATDAADRATTLSDNRDKIVGGYWWKYDEELKDYVNTDIRATGETGQGLNIVGRYLTADELKAAYPDGVVGCFEVGNESPYEIWYYDSPASEWRNSGRLQGPRGMNAYQVWQLQPGNESKTEDEYFDWLSPVIDPETGRWKVQGQDQGVQALGIDAEVTEKENTEESYILHVKSAKGEFDTPNIRGISVKVTEVENTEDSYKLGFNHAKGNFITPNLRGISVKVVEKENTPDRYVLIFTHAKGEFTTPNLRGFDVKVEENAGNTPDDYKLDITTVAGKITTPNLKGRSGSTVIDIDHEPTAADTHYTYNGVQYAFSVGDEVRWYDGDNEEYVLFKCYAVTEAGATWQELGSGGVPEMNIYLQGADHYNETVQVIKNGYLTP